MSNKWGLYVIKKEMTRVWIDGKLSAVTLVSVPSQEILRYKTQDKDWYSCAVVWVDKKELKGKEKGQKMSYKKIWEFVNIDEDFVSSHKEGSLIDVSLLEGIESISIQGISKGKGFQWVMKRYNAKWWPKTHGSKFHRQVGSMGNRKPRRTMKNHPHAGRMWTDQITLKNIRIVDMLDNDWEQILVLKGAIPGHYNAMLKLFA